MNSASSTAFQAAANANIVTTIASNGPWLLLIDVKSLGGDATSIDALEWDANSDGKPTYIAYVAA